MAAGGSIRGNTVIFSAAHTWSANQTFNDNVKLLLGTLGADGELYSDGTDLFFNQLSNGGIMMALASSFPSPDGTAVHIWAGNAGDVTALTGAQLIVENNGVTLLQFAFPDNQVGGISVGTPASDGQARFQYHGPTDTPADTWATYIAANERLRYSVGAFAFQEATVVSSTAGLLTFAGNAGNSFTTPLGFAAPGSLTIASGAVAITKSFHTLVVESGAGSGADSLATATGGVDGDILILKTTTSGANDQVTISDGTGSDTFILAGGADFVMDHLDDRLMLIHNGTEWVEISRSSNS